MKVGRKKTPTAINEHTLLNTHGRIGIMANLSRELLDSRIEKILGDGLKVPPSKVNACYKAMGDRIFALMEANGGTLTRENLIEDVERYDGYLGAFAEADLYVKPDNYDDILIRLREKHGVVIVGPSGTGKTWMSRSLIHDLKNESGPTPKTEKVTSSPSQIGSHAEAGPVIFDVEDPWGKYAASATAQEWAATLLTHFSGATADRRIIVTSRTDFFKAAMPKNLEPWTVKLTAKNYSQAMRRRMYEDRMTRLPQELQRVARDNRSRALATLSTPMEIDKFFILLRRAKSQEESPRTFVSDCIESALGEVIEDTILRQVSNGSLEEEAAYIWGLFKAYDAMTKPKQDAVLKKVADENPALADRIEAYTDHLVAGFFIRLKEGSWSYRHNRVEKGLRESFVSKHRASEAALTRLLSYLIAHDLKASERLAEALLDDSTMSLSLDPSQQGLLDASLLESVFSASPKDVSAALSRFSQLGSEAFLPARLARWLLHKTQGQQSFFPNSWQPLEDSATFYAMVRANDHTPMLLRTFIEHILPQEPWASYSGFESRAYRLDPTIGDTFRTVCIEGFDNPGISSNSVLSKAVLHELDKSEPVVKSALATLAATRKSWIKETRHDWPLINDEYPDEYAQHIIEGYAEETYAAESFVKAYVETKRKKNGWESLQDVITDRDGADMWIQVASRDNKASFEEVTFVAELSRITGIEAFFWRRLSTPRHAKLATLAQRRVLEACDEDIRLEAFKYWADIGEADLAFANELRLKCGVETLMAVLIELNKTDDVDPDGRITGSFLVPRNSKEAALARYLLEIEANQQARPESSEIEALLPMGNRDLKFLTLCALVRLGQNVEKKIISIIEREHAPDNETNAWLDKILGLAVEQDYQLALKTALSSPFASLKAAAIEHYKIELGTVSNVLGVFADNNSRTVLRALLERIKTIGAEHCLDVLVNLTKSTASDRCAVQ